MFFSHVVDREHDVSLTAVLFCAEMKEGTLRQAGMHFIGKRLDSEIMFNLSWLA